MHINMAVYNEKFMTLKPLTERNVMKRKIFSLIALFFGMFVMWLGFVALATIVQSNTSYLFVFMGPIVIAIVMLMAVFDSIKK